MVLASLSPIHEVAKKSRTRIQKTLRAEVKFAGVGVFSGEKANLTVRPEAEDQGIVFYRTDLKKTFRIPATLSSVVATPRCTMLGRGGVTIQTVEHLLAALSSLQIDNAAIDIDGPEVPILDGSSLPFAEAMQEIGIVEQEKERNLFLLKSPVFYSEKDIHIIALPSNSYRVSYMLQFPQSYGIATQFYSTLVEPQVFIQDIAPARTFSAYEEIAPMIEKGLIKGGSLENAVLIQGGKVLNPEGLRMNDEFVRHKILDVIGDFSLISQPFLAHIIAIRSGHASNFAFAKLLENHIKRETA